MVIRMRHTRAHTANRRSHHALKATNMSLCAHCGAKKLPHTACRECGYYRGRKIIDIVGKTEKKQGKAKKSKSIKSKSKKS